MDSCNSLNFDLIGNPATHVDLKKSPDITKSSLNEPIKILLFPPENKEFHFTEDKNEIEVKPQEASNECHTTLTPFVENCSLFEDCPKSQSTPIKNVDCSNDVKIKEILKIEKVFKDSKLEKNCFLKGCKWSGDGLCLLSNSEDNVLRLFEISESLMADPHDIEPVLHMKEGGTVYDYAWYPKMNSSDPVSCVFASTSQGSPIHLWDAYTGHLRATYQPINQYDEVTTAFSLAFSPDGHKIYSGFKKCLRIFDISLPGRISEERNLRTKGAPFQCNIISSICINPVMQDLYALGCYDKTIGIYSEPGGELLCILKGHSGGITQLLFSSDGQYLFSGGRKDNEILCWDIRNPGKVVFSVQRMVETQQKIGFDLSYDQNYLITGTTDCNIKIFNVKNQTGKILPPEVTVKGHDDCVNGVQFHPNSWMFASSSGQRNLPVFFDESDTVEMKNSKVDNSIKIWSFCTPNQISVE